MIMRLTDRNGCQICASHLMLTSLLGTMTVTMAHRPLAACQNSIDIRYRCHYYLNWYCPLIRRCGGVKMLVGQLKCIYLCAKI